jgi:hypothetical protein
MLPNKPFIMNQACPDPQNLHVENLYASYIRPLKSNFVWMKAKNLILLSLFLFVVFDNIAIAEKAPMKYGKVDMADLQMTTYAADTSASAVVLCEYGYFSSNNFQFTHMIRVKILKKEGLRWADHPYPGDFKSDIRGITFNLENGLVVESKLKSENIFRERVAGTSYRLRPAMPNVKVGSIIDIQYSQSFIPAVWYFQRDIPVRWSELIIEPNQYIEFRKNSVGYVPFAVATDMRWVAKDVPSFKDEPYINSDENYMAKFEFDLLRLTIPGNYTEFTTDWNAVNRRLEEDDNFGNTLQGAIFLNSTAKEIEAKYTNPLDKMRAAYEFVKKAVKWNEHESLWTTTTVLSFPYNKKIGNSADVNLILVQLLKKLDFKAYPVAMSSRSNGTIRPFSPSLEKLNYAIACVKDNDKTYLFDATEDLMPMGLLPERALNERGRIINKDFTDWVDITSTKKSKRMIQGTLSFDSNDVLKGKLIYTRGDYAAFNFRKNYQSFNSQDEYLKDFEKDNPGLLVDNCTITDLDSIYKPVITDFDVKIKNRVNNMGDMISINPMLFEQFTENPFKAEERKYPVDFAYPRETIYILNLTIPEGYKVDQMPKPLVIKFPDNSISCMYQVSNTGNTVQVMFKFLINKAVFYATEYGQVKSFYDQMVKKQAELLVFKKI